ncbi:potassium channel family protein [Lacrimispora saccharolytica]|uniref:Trk system potassium uptake protein TrkA n=1 Tax=Lacrimispora saccharolytica (strain ATCC 35040 / DSM 2544 / NRCC 2533 / WM1) TaxID=610130 RepID=D9R750_LACSW|nr:NAD-binding protein [Lacrimispora saccharolytica]ADL05482.1 TrkA-N domain protein [[Clostridium] saccharolyticum WM1]QRV20358.1 NAD-binding protein [Lacrimispora saccharolytica]
MKKKVLLVGGRGKAKSLALSLIKRGYQVTAINEIYDDCLKLAEINKLTVINGDGTKPFILEDADAADCDIAIALTAKDEDNLVICELCKKRFHVKKTVSLVSDPKKTDFFYKMGIDRVVCAISAVTSIIEQQAFVEEMANIVPIGEGRIQIAEVPISGSAPVAGKKIWEISLPKEVIIGCILRSNTAMIPRGDTKILAGDVLVVISDNGQEFAAIKGLTGR